MPCASMAEKLLRSSRSFKLKIGRKMAANARRLPAVSFQVGVRTSAIRVRLTLYAYRHNVCIRFYLTPQRNSIH